MTHTTLDQERESHGSTWAWYHTIDITGLDSAGAESYDPAGRFNAEVLGVDVVGKADEALAVAWDHVDGELTVKNLSDGSDVAAGTAVGELVLEVHGK